jgi:predicted aspartyl protease
MTAAVQGTTQLAFADALGHLPLIRTTMAGKSHWFLIDSGASTHVLAGWFARELALATVDSVKANGVDHAGKPIALRYAGAIAAAVGGLGEVVPDSWPVVDLPEAFEQMGIAGFLSPQRLASEQRDIVFDFPKREMWVAAHVAQAAPLRAGACDGSMVLHATVNGHNARLLVDTGASRTDLLTSSPVATFLPSGRRQQAFVTATGLLSVRGVQSVQLSFGRFSTTTDVATVVGRDDPSCPRDGALAMDVLRNCRVTFSARAVHLACGG